MSPVFGHGRLRLYLLKLLEESPRHGYEVIRLLQDRFLGVYSPSPGTIYPRLARLEEEGLVTHEVVEGKKVFTLTDRGRNELNERMDELAELEREITASVQDIAREVKEDVRQTVRSLRQELTQMAKDINHDSARPGASRRKSGSASVSRRGTNGVSTRTSGATSASSGGTRPIAGSVSGAAPGRRPGRSPAGPSPGRAGSRTTPSWDGRWPTSSGGSDRRPARACSPTRPWRSARSSSTRRRPASATSSAPDHSARGRGRR
jgi:DNA-binding PadR family transcriptional regulator